MHSSPVGIRQEQYADRPGYDAPSTPLSAKTLLLFCRGGTEEGSRGPLLFLSEKEGETSNLLEALEHTNDYLKRNAPYYKEPSR